jgi:cell division septation protein DedD
MLKSGRLASPTQDDGFHEIQLNGKQLVFLFMSATVVSVVIFLCGVFVGRGVRTERTIAVADANAQAPAVDVAPQPPAATPTPAPAGSDPTAAAPPPAVDDLSYFNRLQKESPSPEKLKPAGKAAPAAAADAPDVRAKAAPPPKASEAPAASSSDGSDHPWGVQVAAVNERGAADAIAKRLSSKGYPAYVVTPAAGTSVFRVRVGRFGTRREAEPLKARLEKEEQFKPWITR